MVRRRLTFNINTKDGQKQIIVQLWLMPGHLDFLSRNANYYKSLQGLLLVYDITKRITFCNISDLINCKRIFRRI